MPTLVNYNSSLEKSDEGTEISVSKCQYVVALFLLGKFRKKFGNWTNGVTISLFGDGSLLNSTANVRVFIPRSTNGGMEAPFTKEWFRGYLSGLNEFLDRSSHEEIMKVVVEEVLK